MVAMDMASYAGKSSSEIEADISKDIDRAISNAAKIGAKTFQIAKASAAWTADFLAELVKTILKAIQWLIRALIAFARYVAQSFGVKLGEQKAADESEEEKQAAADTAKKLAPEDAEAALAKGLDDAKADVPAMSFVGPAKDVAPAAAAFKEGVSGVADAFIEMAPAINELKGADGDKFLSDALEKVAQRVESLQSERSKRIEAISPQVQEAARRIGTPDVDKAFEIFAAQESVLRGIDPSGDLLKEVKAIVELEKSIQKGVDAFALYVVAAEDDEKLRQVADSVVAKINVPGLKEGIDQIAKTQQNVTSRDEFVASNVQSRNNLLRLVSVDGNPELADQIAKARVDSVQPPPGVSRFSSVIGVSVGDFPEEDDGVEAPKSRESDR